MSLESVQSNKETLSERVAAQIIGYIQENQLKEGDRLPNEQNLGIRLNVSRTTIREAMRLLVSRHIVEVKRGSGTYVTAMPGMTEDPFGFGFVYDKARLVMDLLEIRFLFEPEIAALAAERASDEEIAEIRVLAGKVEKCIASGVNHSGPDIDFHMMIVKSTGNEVLVKLMPVIMKGVPLFVEMTRDRILRETIQTHRKIADAIAGHDAAGARKAMTEHLQYNKSILEIPGNRPDGRPAL